MKNYFSSTVLTIGILVVLITESIGQSMPMDISNVSSCDLQIQMIAQSTSNCTETCTTEVYCANAYDITSIPPCENESYEWMYCIVTTADVDCNLCTSTPITKIIANIFHPMYDPCNISYPRAETITGNYCCDGDNDVYWSNNNLINL